MLLINSSSSASRIRTTLPFVLGSVLASGGSLLRLWCHRTLGRFFTWELAIRKEHKLITTGPYSFVRHPAYLGATMMSTGTILTHFTPGSWLVESGILDTTVGKIIAVGYIVHWAMMVPIAIYRTVKEDEVLSKEFGTEWQAWARRTPYRMIPFIF